MSWIIACKQYQKQRGDGAKYIVPKKGSSEYEEVNKIFDSLEKPPKKEKVKPEKKPKKEPVPVPKKEIKQEDSIRTVIRNELIQQIREQGLDSLTVDVV